MGCSGIHFVNPIEELRGVGPLFVELFCLQIILSSPRNLSKKPLLSPLPIEYHFS